MSLILSFLILMALAPMVIKAFAWLILWVKRRIKKTYETIMEIIEED